MPLGMTKTLCAADFILRNSVYPPLTAPPYALAFGSNFDRHPKIGTEMLRSRFALGVLSQSRDL
jgi:hypothetical protein